MALKLPFGRCSLTETSEMVWCQRANRKVELFFFVPRLTGHRKRTEAHHRVRWKLLCVICAPIWDSEPRSAGGTGMRRQGGFDRMEYAVALTQWFTYLTVN